MRWEIVDGSQDYQLTQVQPPEEQEPSRRRMACACEPARQSKKPDQVLQMVWIESGGQRSLPEGAVPISVPDHELGLDGPMR